MRDDSVRHLKVVLTRPDLEDPVKKPGPSDFLFEAALDPEGRDTMTPVIPGACLALRTPHVAIALSQSVFKQ